MKHLSRILITLVMIVLPLLSAGLTAQPVAAQSPYTCLPTCSIIDARFLTLAGKDFATLAGDTINLEIATSSSSPSFELGIFDGDTSKTWDYGIIQDSYTLYADPLGDGTGATLVGQWMGSAMLDNAWFTQTITNIPPAQSASGNYFYVLHVVNTNYKVKSANAFKVRATGLLFMFPQAVSFIGAVWGTNEYPIVYPQWPALSPTTYDGKWDMYLSVPTSITSFSVWDGDLDFGRYDCSLNDTNDPNTPDTPFLPDWAPGTDAVPEGVAISDNPCTNSAGAIITGPNGQKYTTGNPPDEYNDSINAAFRRSPDIQYSVTLPDSTSFMNRDPSGNQEWELYRIGSDPSEVPSVSDATHSGVLPAGTYQIHMDGVDLHNLNAYRFFYKWLGICEDGTVCIPILHTYKVGDTVWYDANRNGVQDPGETGISGVTVNLLDSANQVIGTTVTNANGYYDFNVDPGTYTVQVAASNFVSGGVMAGYVNTTPNQKTDTVTTANVMTYDFGYYQPASIGDFVWNDVNGNGVQDIGEPGIPNVTLHLLDQNGNVIGTTTSDKNGIYVFSNLLPGTYTVVVDTSTLPAGMVPTYDLDGGLDNKATSPLTAGQNLTTVDFGYVLTGSIGDFVWNDINGNGIQDSGEPGITGATVKLLDSAGTTVIRTTTTSASGQYSFTGLFPGAYYIQFVAPSGYTFTLKNAVGSTTGNDSNPASSTGKTDVINLAQGQNEKTIDGGLYKTVPCGSALCGYIRTPGFWKNYSTHMTSATFLNLVAHTQDFSFLTVAQAVTILGTNNGTTNMGISALDGTNATFLKFLLTAEINAVWNGNDSAAGLGGQMGWGIYMGTSSTVDQILHQAYLHRKTYSTTEYGYVLYLGAGGEGQSSCLILPPPPCTPCQPKLGSIGDYVWKDLNGNGIQDSAETGIQSVTVRLMLSDGITEYLSTTTDAYGKYAFKNLPPGKYYVVFVLPAGYTFTTANVGTDDTRDSDANTSTGVSPLITLASGQSNTTVDAGMKKSCGCTNNLVANPSFELNTGTPPMYWINGWAGTINVPAVDGKNVGYISGTGVMYQNINITVGKSYTLTFYSGSHNPKNQTVKIQYYDAGNVALGTPAVHTITSDLEITGFGGPYTLTLPAAPTNAKYLRISVSANGYDYAKVDALCLQAK